MPNTTIAFLSDFSRDHAVDEKIFVVPSFQTGRQIGQALAASGGAWLNLRFLTFTALALEAAGPAARERARGLLPAEELLDLVEAVLAGLKRDGQLEYFGADIPVRSLAAIVGHSLDDLRMTGLTSAALDPASFVVEKKGAELKLILGTYEQALAASGGWDPAGLFRVAVEALALRPAVPGERRAWYLALEAQRLTVLERGLLTAAAGDRLVLVPRDGVQGLEPVRAELRLPLAVRPVSKGPASDMERLGWLFEPGVAPPPFRDGTVMMFRAAGVANECREVLRRIFEERTPFDRIEVIVPRGTMHGMTFYMLGRKENLPLTFADGIPLNMTSPGRALLSLLDWIGGGFQASLLADLLESGDLRAGRDGGSDGLPGHRAARLLLRAGIGWGRERYMPCLEALECDLRKRLEDGAGGRGEDDGDGAAMKLAIEETSELRSAVGRIMDVVPEAGGDGTLDFRKLCVSLERLLAEAGRRCPAGPFDEEGLEAAISMLRRLRSSGAGDPPMLGAIEAADRIRAAASDTAVGRSSPRPGHLHVSSYVSGGWSGRSLTFVAGLDEARFPGHERQDPLLLDDERRGISPGLATSADSLRAGLFRLAGTLAALRGRIVLSYPYFDVMEERQVAPSPLLLQTLRLMEGRTDLDYSALDAWFGRNAGAEAAYVPGSEGKVFDETDWWLARLGRRKRAADASGILKRTFPSLAEGIKAAAGRSGPEVGVYDGFIGAAARKYDPRVDRGLVFSPTRLEKLADCPYAYFLRYLLRIEPPDRLEFDPAVWLDPRHLGTLLHNVFCDFMTGVKSRGERVSRAAHREEIRGLAAKVIGEFRQEIPPPSERVYEYERRKIMTALDVFLKVEEDRQAGEQPFEFEKPFEIDVDVSVPEIRASRRMEDGSGAGRGAFRLKGFIDRVDRLGPDRYKVIDYKTGGFSRFEDFKESGFGGGRHLQPALYALAVECLYGVRAAVEESGYFFPTEKGEGREIMNGGFDRAALASLVRDLLDIEAGGLFMPADDGSCLFCDYQDLCGGSPEAMKYKSINDPKPFGLILRVRGY